MPVPLSLWPTGAADGEGASFTDLVDRIYQERGHMRDVTKESLQAETEQQEAAISDAESVAETVEEDSEHNVDSHLKKLFEAKEEMMNLVGEANNEMLMLQDMVSLLMSKDAPKAASSISPALKEMTSAGTLGFDRNPPAIVERAESDKARTQADGLNFQSINATADKLLSSATKLETEVTKETRYWEQILSVTERGWNITKVRGSAHTLGVRYACSEAGPQYQAAGQASLRPSEDGGLTFDNGSHRPRNCLRVRIAKAGYVIESSTLPQLVEAEDDPLELMVNQARDSLFDEELFHHLSREARDLLALGVRVKQDTISLPLDGQAMLLGQRPSRSTGEILIDLTERDESVQSEGERAEAVAMYLRLGLIHTYRQRYLRRTRPPPPLSGQKVETEGLSLLKSSLSLIEHHHATSTLQKSLTELTDSVRNAGMECTLDVHRDSSLRSRNTGKQPAAKKAKPHSAAENLFSSFLEPQSTSFTLRMPSSFEITLCVSTHLCAPQYGTTYEIVSLLPRQLVQTLETSLRNPAEILSYTENRAREHLLDRLGAACPHWRFDKTLLRLVSRSDAARCLTVKLADGKMLLVEVQDTSSWQSSILAAWDGHHFKTRASVEGTTLMAIVESAAK